MTVITVNDTLSADRALRLIDRGSTLVWDGDFQNAKQLLGDCDLVVARILGEPDLQ